MVFRSRGPGSPGTALSGIADQDRGSRDSPFGLPAAEGSVGMYIAILPDADRGMPRWGSVPATVKEHGSASGVSKTASESWPATR